MHFKMPHIVFYVICLFTITLSLLPVKTARAADDSIFTVQGVKVDITAEDAADAREEAFTKAQYTAFERLASRLLSEHQLEYFKVPEISVISALVKDFEITDEKISNVRYVGTYTFRFQNDAVRNFFASKGMAYTDVGSKPVLILPFYQWGARNILWDDANPWLRAWSNLQYFQGLVPVIIPIGDLQDVSDIGDDEALTYNPDSLEAMKKRYGAGEAIIMMASPSWSTREKASAGQPPEGLTIMVYRTDHGRPEFANRITVSRDDILANENIFSAAVRLSRENLQRAWKSQTLTNAGQARNLKVRVKFGSMQEWIETQKTLRSVQAVDEIKLLSLKQNEANIELKFSGTEERLRIALAQSDMSLTAPRIDFGAYRNGYQNRYGRHSSPTYDLYLNKYHHSGNTYR